MPVRRTKAEMAATVTDPSAPIIDPETGIVYGSCYYLGLRYGLHQTAINNYSIRFADFPPRHPVLRGCRQCVIFPVEQCDEWVKAFRQDVIDRLPKLPDPIE
jgi:hypothetical protein